MSQRRRRTFMNNGNGVSRRDRNRSVRLGRLRALVPVSNAIVGIDLADKKQMVVVCDLDAGDLDRTRRLRPRRFEHQVCREITRRGGWP
jgi:hypothetical protein